MKKYLLSALLFIPSFAWAVCNPFVANTVLTASALNAAISSPCITSGTISGTTITNNNGSASAPSMMFAGSTNTGFYWANPGIGMSVAGANVGTWTSTGLNSAAIGMTTPAQAQHSSTQDTLNWGLQILKDSSPLNYAGTTHAAMVVQQRDTLNDAVGVIVPGVVFQFNTSGSGVVNSATEHSSSIWQGVYGFQNKTGDGSAHSFTATGQLGAVGSGGYNELGGFQGTLTNTGSALGTMSGVEVHLLDSPNGGTNNYSTKMQGVVSGIAKYNPTIRISENFYASSEGSLAPNAILAINPSSTVGWQRGLDFSGYAGTTFTLGQWVLAPNNTNAAWLDASGAAQNILGVSNTNITYLRPASSAAYISLQNYAGTNLVQINGSGTNVLFPNSVRFGGTSAPVATVDVTGSIAATTTNTRASDITLATGRAVQNTASQATATIAAGIASTYIATPAATITITLAAPTGDGERRRVCVGAATTATWNVTAPATTTAGLPTSLIAGQCVEAVYNSVAGTPTNSTATTWYVY